MSEPTAVGRILDAAEDLFALQGIAATSVRAVTRRAGMNPAAVHYHFGTKDELVRALLRRRMGPLSAERLVLLEHVLRGNGDAAAGEPSLEAILDAFLRPVMRHAGEESGALGAVLFGLPAGLRQELLDELFGAAHQRFHAALRRALPELTPAEVEERFRFANAVMQHVASGQLELYPSDARALPRRSSEGRLRAMVEFLAHGMRAPGGRA